VYVDFGIGVLLCLMAESEARGVSRRVGRAGRLFDLLRKSDIRKALRRTGGAEARGSSQCSGLGHLQGVPAFNAHKKRDVGPTKGEMK